jgi:hypothetical protein
MVAIRSWYIDHNAIASAALPRELHPDPEHANGGIPHLHSILTHPATCALHMIVRLHNQAGIPIIQGHATVAAGERQCSIHDLVVLGIDAYQQKCVERIERFRDQSKTLLFVSHDMPMIQRFCDRAIWLRHGQVIADGPADRVTAEYAAGSLYATQELPESEAVACWG